MNPFEASLKDVTDVFESCGCTVNVKEVDATRVALCIHGPTAMCPPSIFEEHVEKAKEAMRLFHPTMEFHVEVEETD